MTLIDTEPSSTPTEGRHRWPIVTVAAAAVVVLGIGALILVARDDSGPQVPADTTVDTTVAPDTATADEADIRAYIDAYNANDAERMLTYLTDDGLVADFGSADALRREVAWNKAARYKAINTTCERVDGGTDAGTTLRCVFDRHALGSDAIGLGPFRGYSSTLTARDGKVLSVPDGDAEALADEEGFLTQAWQPFASWIKSEHPDDIAVMYTDSSQDPYTWATTDEAIRLWELRVDEYVQAVLTGPDTYAADIAAICATQAAQLAELISPAEGAFDQVATWNTAAAAILQQTRGALTALDTPPLMDTTAYQTHNRQLIPLVRSFEATAEAATAGDSTGLAELDAEYLDLRQAMASGPAGSGLEQCLASIPTMAMSGTRAT